MSIQADEIRVGNRFIRELRNERGLEYDHDFVLTEEYMGKLFGDSIALALQDLFPIPISTEILLACGFTKYPYPDHSERTMRNMYFIKCDYVQITFAMGETILAGKNDSEADEQCVLSKSVKHLHQLQNLYYSLTGKELIYTPS